MVFSSSSQSNHKNDNSRLLHEKRFIVWWRRLQKNWVQEDSQGGGKSPKDSKKALRNQTHFAACGVDNVSQTAAQTDFRLVTKDYELKTTRKNSRKNEKGISSYCHWHQRRKSDNTIRNNFTVAVSQNSKLLFSCKIISRQHTLAVATECVSQHVEMLLLHSLGNSSKFVVRTKAPYRASIS